MQRVIHYMHRYILLSFFFNHIIINLCTIFVIVSKALSEKGAYEEADSLFKKVHEIYPDNATFLVHRGNKVPIFIVFQPCWSKTKYIFLALVVLSWKSSINEAFEFLEQALKIDPKCDYAYETLGTLYIQT